MNPFKTAEINGEYDEKTLRSSKVIGASIDNIGGRS
jgi:hypothetical protein